MTVYTISLMGCFFFTKSGFLRHGRASKIDLGEVQKKFWL